MPEHDLAPAAQNQYHAPAAAAELRKDQMDVLHHNHVVIDETVGPLYPPEDIGLPGEVNGIEMSVVGEIALPGKELYGQDTHIAILKARNSRDGQVRYALQGLTIDDKGKALRATIKPIVIGSVETGVGRTLIGRDKEALPQEALWGNHETYSHDVSRKHLELFTTANGLVVRDMSTNGSRIKVRKADHIDNRFMADHTTHAEEMARLRGLMSEDGKFAHRKPITRDTEVRDGMVDNRSRFAGNGAESIVVDSTKPEDAKQYAKLYKRFEDKLAEVELWGGRKPEEGDVLRSMYETVVEAMEYDLAYVDDMAEWIKQRTMETTGATNVEKSHLKANLALYLEDGKGVCRHMALAVGWLGGKAKDAGLLQGRTTAEVNQDNADRAAHEWARYTDKDGKVYILDPAQQFFGRLEDSMRGNRWHYFRPGEYQTYLKKVGGNPVNRMIEGVPYDWAQDPESF